MLTSGVYQLIVGLHQVAVFDGSALSGLAEALYIEITSTGRLIRDLIIIFWIYLLIWMWFTCCCCQSLIQGFIIFTLPSHVYFDDRRQDYVMLWCSCTVTVVLSWHLSVPVMRSGVVLWLLSVPVLSSL